MTFVRSLACAVILILCQRHVSAQNVIDTAPLTFTTIDVPGAAYTGIWGINKSGDMVGNYGQDTNGASYGFLYSNGNFTYFDYPGESVTVPRGINDSGLIVGYTGSNPVFGFLYDGTNFTTLQDASDSATFSNGINNAGLVVGGAGTIYTTKGFQMKNGHFKPVSPSGSYIYVYATGINNLGTIVGWTDNDGFACRPSGCQTVHFPGSIKTEALGVNDAGITVGWYNPGSSNAYAFVLKNGKYTSFSYPGAIATAATSVNASGQIVGQYTFDFQTYHGFVTSPINTADLQ